MDVGKYVGKFCDATGVEKDMVETGMEKVGEVVAMGTGTKKVEIDIDKVREAASAHFEDLTKDQKEAARSFFQDMDKDSSGTIRVEEFRNFLTLAGFETENCDWLFGELDKDQNGTLDFKELVTFFYVLSCDEYKPILTRANTGKPDPKAESDRPTARANDPGQRLNMGVFTRAHDELKDVYKLDSANVSECSIV